MRVCDLVLLSLSRIIKIHPSTSLFLLNTWAFENFVIQNGIRFKSFNDERITRDVLAWCITLASKLPMHTCFLGVASPRQLGRNRRFPNRVTLTTSFDCGVSLPGIKSGVRSQCRYVFFFLWKSFLWKSFCIFFRDPKWRSFSSRCFSLQRGMDSLLVGIHSFICFCLCFNFSCGHATL